MSDTCRYCGKEITADQVSTLTYSYWSGIPFPCHRACKDAGMRQEAFDCQCIDADCNDCKHFQRGTLVQRWLSCIEDGKPSKKLVNMGIFTGHCLKFNQPTEAYPNKWTGHPCFEHRRS